MPDPVGQESIGKSPFPIGLLLLLQIHWQGVKRYLKCPIPNTLAR